MQKALKRKTRLQAPARRAGPAVTCGDAVSVVSDVEWRNMQRLASAAHSPLTAGRSFSALWLWYEDPTASSLVAPIL